MEGRYGLYSQGSSGWTSFKNEELQEDDVWSVLNERNRDYYNNSKNVSKQSSTIIPRPLPTASKIIPKAHNKNPISPPNKLVQQSAPVNTPDWSKIYGKTQKTPKSSKNHASFDQDDDYDDADADANGYGVMRGSSWDSDDDDYGDMMPPHEWIARKLASSQISSFSVCEGVGRTLKGRDLSRVRNAVLTKTGFLE